MFAPFFTLDGWIALATLTVLEVVLGIDNIIFLAIVANRVDERQRKLARRIGLLLALVMRIGLLASMKGASPILAVEAARRAIPHHVRPTFQEMDKACRKSDSIAEVAA